MVYYLWGYRPNSHNMIHKWYPPQFNSPLGFINPGLTLQKLGVQKPSEHRLTQILQPRIEAATSSAIRFPLKGNTHNCIDVNGETCRLW